MAWARELGQTEGAPYLAQMRSKTFGKLVGHHWPHYATI